MIIAVDHNGVSRPGGDVLDGHASALRRADNGARGLIEHDHRGLFGMLRRSLFDFDLEVDAGAEEVA